MQIRYHKAISISQSMIEAVILQKGLMLGHPVPMDNPLRTKIKHSLRLCTNMSFSFSQDIYFLVHTHIAFLACSIVELVMRGAACRPSFEKSCDVSIYITHIVYIVIYHTLMTRADRKSQVRQNLGFSLADSLAKEDQKSAVLKTKQCLTRDFLLALVISV